VLSMQSQVLALAREYEAIAAKVPGKMMADTRSSNITAPFKDLFSGFDRSLDYALRLAVKQFDGGLAVAPVRLKPGEPFELEISLHNLGVIPWLTGAGNDLLLEGETQRLGLPSRWAYEGPPMVFGDRRLVRLRGVAPQVPGATKLKINLLTSYRDWVLSSQTVELLEESVR
jgi:hypothetical protein